MSKIATNKFFARALHLLQTSLGEMGSIKQPLDQSDKALRRELQALLQWTHLSTTSTSRDACNRLWVKALCLMACYPHIHIVSPHSTEKSIIRHILDDALTIDTQHPITLFLLGLYYEVQQEYSLAAAYYSISHQSNPKLALPLDRLTALYEFDGWLPDINTLNQIDSNTSRFFSTASQTPTTPNASEERNERTEPYNSSEASAIHTDIHEAAKKGDIYAMAYCISQGVSLFEDDTQQRTAYQYYEKWIHQSTEVTDAHRQWQLQLQQYARMYYTGDSEYMHDSYEIGGITLPSPMHYVTTIHQQAQEKVDLQLYTAASITKRYIHNVSLDAIDVDGLSEAIANHITVSTKTNASHTTSIYSLYDPFDIDAKVHGCRLAIYANLSALAYIAYILYQANQSPETINNPIIKYLYSRLTETHMESCTEWIDTISPELQQLTHDITQSKIITQPLCKHNTDAKYQQLVGYRRGNAFVQSMERMDLHPDQYDPLADLANQVAHRNYDCRTDFTSKEPRIFSPTALGRWARTHVTEADASFVSNIANAVEYERLR